MNECPAGYDLKDALFSLKCQRCDRQCVIEYLVKEITNLQLRLSTIEQTKN